MEQEKAIDPPDSGQDRSKDVLDEERESVSVPSSTNCEAASERKDEQPHTPKPDEESASRNSSPGRSSPESVCAVCLSPFHDKSFADTCFHPFCFNCLCEWSKVKPECPLCKQSFSSIVHNVRSMEDYDQYHLVSKSSQSSWHSSDGRRFRYSSTLTAERLVERQSQNDITTQSEFARHRLFYAPHSFRAAAPPIPPVTFSEPRVSLERQNIYASGLWANKPNGRIRIRCISPLFFQENPACTHRLIPWLNRELVALLHGSETCVVFVLDLILSLIMRYEIRSEEFHLHLEPYLESHTRHFVHEFFHYASSPFDMEGYDRSVTYSTPHNSEETIILSPERSASGDCVQLSSSDTSRTTTSSRPRKKKSKKQSKHLTKLYLRRNQESNSWNVLRPLPPSSESVRTYLYNDFESFNIPFTTGGPSTSHYNNTIIVSSSPPTSIELGDTTDDECEIIECVKPRHLRTPEMVDLISDDERMDVPVESHTDTADPENGIIAENIPVVDSQGSQESTNEAASLLNTEPVVESRDDNDGSSNRVTTDPLLSCPSSEQEYTQQWCSLQISKEVVIPHSGQTDANPYDDSTDISDCNTKEPSVPQIKDTKKKNTKLSSVVCTVNSEHDSKASSSHSSSRKTHKLKHKKKKHERHRSKHYKSRSRSRDRK